MLLLCCVLQLLDSQLDEWMDAFHTLATFNNEQLSALDAAGDPEKQGALDAVKAAGGCTKVAGRSLIG